MSSNSIYPHVPYFYVIEHVASGKKYAGSRWAKGCNPAEFMTEGGYCTSSASIRKIIEEEGLSAFAVVEIKTIDEIGNVYDYETKFLTENDCAKSDLWLNKHNNTKVPSYGSEEFKALMLANHGVENSFQSEEVQEKSRQTMLAKYGVEHAMQSEEVREKSRQTMLKNHGVEHPMQTKENREHRSNLNYERSDLKVRTEILNGDFSRFVYLYDTVENVFLMGVEKSLNRGLKTKRYIKIGANRSFNKYIDVLNGRTYKMNASKFSKELPVNFVVLA
jgi:hypothetical protein